jgi:hypothetical protein
VREKVNKKALDARHNHKTKYTDPLVEVTASAVDV